MSLAERAPFLVGFVLLAALLLGLYVRRLHRVCYSFPAWLLAVLAGDVMIFYLPRRFYTWGFWMAKETVYAALKLAIAMEITARAFQAFAAARATVGRVMLAVLLALLAFVLVGVRYDVALHDLARELHRRVANGVALVFCAAWAVVLYYRLPLHRLHRAVLRGLVPYLLVFAAASTFTLVLGWDRRAVNAAETGCWNLMLAYWCWEVWRRPPGGESDFIRRLQPWRRI